MSHTLNKGPRLNFLGTLTQFTNIYTVSTLEAVLKGFRQSTTNTWAHNTHTSFIHTYIHYMHKINMCMYLVIFLRSNDTNFSRAAQCDLHYPIRDDILRYSYWKVCIHVCMYVCLYVYMYVGVQKASIYQFFLVFALNINTVNSRTIVDTWCRIHIHTFTNTWSWNLNQ